ncbi:unnamed protein product [Dicrocoelium dendriticum]|nr:unnamed protein product [Dicrocoelium dendriticum]
MFNSSLYLRVATIKGQFLVSHPLSLSYFHHIAGKNCGIHWWFYEPGTKELTCVCNVSNVLGKDGKLLIGGGNSRGILSIAEDKFKAYDDILQGSFVYALNIWTEWDANQTARSLFPPLAPTVFAQPHVHCDPHQHKNNTYFCVIVHYNIENVTWDYPENWIGPVRYLRNIFYDQRKITVQVVGMHWSPKLSSDSGQFHVDTVVEVKAGEPDICNSFSREIHRDSLKFLTKCRVEFFERAITTQSKLIAKLNLKIEAKNTAWKTNARTALGMANLWKRHNAGCMFPVYLREDTASYGMHTFSNTRIN